MKAVFVLMMLAITGPAFAEEPAQKPAPIQNQKPFPFDYDGPGLKAFVTPTPVTSAPAPKIVLRPTMPLNPDPSPNRHKPALGEHGHARG
jgi:hypothetical protein